MIPSAHLLTFPKPEYLNDNKLWLSLVPTYLSWSFMPLVSILTVMFVLEKEKKIKEAMLMMGLKTSAYWISWVLIEGILVLVLSIVITIVIYFSKIIENINILIIFLLLFLFGISMIGISALISPFFKKEKVAGSFVTFVTLIASLVHLLVIFLDVPPYAYYLISLVSPVAFTLGLNSISRKTIDDNTRLAFNNLFEDPIFSVGAAVFMLLFDCLLYTLLAIYLDQVIPGEYGPKQSFLFCFKKSYWFPPKHNRLNLSNEVFQENNPDYEDVSDEFKEKSVINILNITKKFKNGKKETVAVNNISISIYESQITAILGHNGAGKSTLINMLIGMTSPNSGTASLYGYDITNAADIGCLRSMFGVCLQEDILFDVLNSEEHLLFFGGMKGIQSSELNSQVDKLLNEVKLFDDRLTPSKFLSGGQKRKLCIAIALIANPKIIILDEPTSGVDAYSRRQLWSLLQSYKKDRVIILTTHFMDEADVLSDRKAIICNGILRCVGSSLFLKNRFGIGYHLTLVFKNGTNVDHLNSLVESKITNSKLDRFTSSEAIYTLPPTQTQSFPKLFEALELEIAKQNGFIESFGISMTTLEEVFLRIGEEYESEDHKIQYSTCNSGTFESVISYNNDCNPTFFKSFLAFLRIRFLIFIRNPMHILPIIVLPIITILVSYFLMKSDQPIHSQPKSLLLNPTIYDQNRVLLYKNWTNDSIDALLSSFTSFEIKSQPVGELDLNDLSYNNSYMALNISSFNINKSDIYWNLLFNETFYHSLPILQNLITNVYYNLINTSSNSLINTYNHPFPQTDQDMNLYSFDGKIYTYVVLMAILLGSIPPSIAVEVVEDREAKIKNLLRVCGLTFKAYWITTLVCHLIMFSISSILILVMMVFVLKLQFLHDIEAVISVILLFILFMPTSLLASYVLTHIFNKRDTARSILPLICYLPGMFMVMSVSLITSFNPETGTLMHQIFCFIYPFYVPQGCLYWVATASNTKKIYESAQNHSIDFSYFDWNKNITICFIALLFHLILFSILLFFVDLLKSGESVFEIFGFKKTYSSESSVEFPSLEDEDVLKERTDVIHYLTNGYRSKTPVLLVNDLRKEFITRNIMKTFRKGAKSVTMGLNQLNLMIEPGNIFGLLGPNGAGKTTAIKIIICEERPSQGVVLIDGKKVKSSISDVFQSIGYCPQQDALWKEITVSEHLRLYASIRGIPANNIESICSEYLQNLQIREHSDKRIQDLSGGTKRKLCFLISLLGTPKLVLLDEPSTGMDPQSKRFLWDTISKTFQKSGDKCAVLTTHSMEEADALCTRLSIIIKGVMRCIGSLQHLKNKYGAGYLLEIKLIQQKDSHNVEHIKKSVRSTFVGAVIKEEYNNKLVLAVPQSSVNSLSTIFYYLENLKQSITSIEEYSFSQTTIEQVFISFAKEQEIEH